MRNPIRLALYVCCFFLFGFPFAAYSSGSILPVPIFKSANVIGVVRYDSTYQIFRYNYTVSNPSTNTGEIWKFRIDVSSPSGDGAFQGSDFRIPMGSQSIGFNQLLDQISSLKSYRKIPVMPFGQTVPAGWNGGLEVTGYADFSSSDDTPNIMPGQSLGGFELQSFGVPTFRNADVMPLWIYETEDHEADTDADLAAGGQIEQSLIFSTRTIGPSTVHWGTYEHWQQLKNDLNTIVAMGWISDVVLRDKLVSSLAAANNSMLQQDGTTAKSQLADFMSAVQAAPPQNITPSAASLLLVNAQVLTKYTPDTPIPMEPKVVLLTPTFSKLPFGTTARIQAKYVNAADKDKPIEGYQLHFFIENGENFTSDRQVTDANGIVTFSYVGENPGTDNYFVGNGGEVPVGARGAIIWSGNVDLTVPLFIPPMLQTQGNRTFFVTETTTNQGTLPSSSSVTRYTITSNPDSVTDARVVGQRTVPSLPAGQSSTVTSVPLTIPSDLPKGLYYLAACADADGVVEESNEGNNCSYSTVDGSVVVPIDPGTDSLPPVCSKATPSISQIWPPNHKLANVNINNVTSPSKLPVKVTITGITQDEPTNGLGDGDTAIDGFGIGTQTAQVRAERSGLGNGRVYVISFKGQDSLGGSCTGSVSVGVPHDQGNGSVPIDSGQKYDSTK